MITIFNNSKENKLSNVLMLHSYKHMERGYKRIGIWT